MTRPTAVVLGFIGKLPFAGMTLFNLQYMIALQRMGYRVHYVEVQGEGEDYYDPSTDAMTSNLGPALEWLRATLGFAELGGNDFSLLSRSRECLGSSLSTLRGRIREADFLLSLCDLNWSDELLECKRRFFVDGDPLFTQSSMLNQSGTAAGVLANYDTLFTYAMRIGEVDCAVPTAGREWLRTRPIALSDFWNVTDAERDAPVVALMSWKSGGEAVIDGVVYGYKNREFPKFADLPRRVSERLVLAIGGSAPLGEYRALGWELASPLEMSRTIAAYKDAIAGARADLGVAKHAYVESRSGWFSDRSTCFLASGRPVLHQDTGFTDWLDCEKGVIAFSTLEELVEGISALRLDYAAHCRAARQTAISHFDAETVVASMLKRAGVR